LFTGIVECVGRIVRAEHGEGGSHLCVDGRGLDPDRTRIGDSVAVAGVCLTVSGHEPPGLLFDLSAETLSRTVLGSRAPGDLLNLESAALPTTALGGHLVSGHVDGIAEVVRRTDDGGSVRVSFRLARELAPYLAVKGSVCVDGVSLTVNRVQDRPTDVEFEVNLIPHTLSATTLRDLGGGDAVHVEADIVARYLWRMARWLREPDGGDPRA
jgi:riboflavin synthase